MDIEWTAEAYAHVYDGHQITATDIAEAMKDPDLLVIDPDPASKSGLSVRIMAATRDHGVISVIAFRGSGRLFGATAFPCHKGPYYRAYAERSH